MAATSVTVDMPALADVTPDGAREASSIAAIAEAWEAALRARAPAQHAGTPLVRKLAAQVSRQLGLGRAERVAVDVCAQIRDIGMIKLPDSVVLKTGPLSPQDWALLNRHPELGAELLQSFPTMAESAALVRAHHERWDASDRPHRRGIGAEGAMEYIVSERGAQFDRRTVDSLWAVITGRDVARQRAALSTDEPAAPQPVPPAARTISQPREVRKALAEFDLVPAFGPALERALEAAGFAGPLGGSDLASVIESDLGMTVAVLRAAQRRSDTPVASVPEAVALLRAEEIRDAITSLPTVAFPWQTKFEALLLRCGSHAQGVARAADRIAQRLQPFGRDELVAAALLHDMGKLLLALMWPDFALSPAVPPTPEEALRQERRALGFDHASLGGLLADRWGLATPLACAIAGHHSAYAPAEPATLVRLADMLVHHAHGDTVDRDVMLRLASRCELSVDALRAIVGDLPHTGGGARRRAERSPLSGRETDILRLLADGSRVAGIAQEFHLSESTVRTHLHNIYAKLEVPDRAQAVLRSTEMGWI